MTDFAEFDGLDRPSLIAPAVSQAFARVAYSGGHGVEGGDIGFAMVYYLLAYGLRSQTCVCLGSGAGFVPGLMRQGQIDAGLHGSRTYLVDAIMPEAGFGSPDIDGGWLSLDSILRHRYPDIALLNCTTDEASRDFFAKLGRPIDYLHIDADHSFDQAFRDFRNFLPLLSDKAAITFHDARTGDIARVLDAIEADHPHWGRVDFKDIGQGIAILRRKQGVDVAPTAGKVTEQVSEGLSREISVAEIRADSMTWEYLKHPALYARHALAAQWLRGDETVFEIGGYETPIAGYLRTAPKRIIVVDPLAEPKTETSFAGKPCDVRFMNIDLDDFPADLVDREPYELVFLGMDLDRSQKTIKQDLQTVARFAYFLSRAKRAVIEFPALWTPSVRLFNALMSVLRPKILFECTLDLTQNTIDNGGRPTDPARLKRRLLVIEDCVPLETPQSGFDQFKLILFGTRNLPDLSEGRLTLRDGVLKLADASALGQGRVAHKSGEVKVDCVPLPWNYSAALPFAEKRPRGEIGVALVELTCLSGRVGVGATDGRDIFGEQVADAEVKGPQRLEIAVQDGHLMTGLLVRNARAGAGESSAIIHSVSFYS